LTFNKGFFELTRLVFDSSINPEIGIITLVFVALYHHVEYIFVAMQD
jgi:hypothetical protein